MTDLWTNSTRPITLNAKADGYIGIWYYNQPSNDEYVYKYSGGYGTYCAKHQPFAIYCPEVEKTFFCYGGRYPEKNQLLHMASCFDHKTGMVPRPTVIVDKETSDAHDNPVISVDAEGFIWIFSSSHGTGRPSYIHRSRKPYDIDAFDWVLTTNFSYPQPWFIPGKGFFFAHTVYNKINKGRTLCWSTSPDGIHWAPSEPLAMIEMGHYQVSAAHGEMIGSAFNMHPAPHGLNWRTNLYFAQTPDFGVTWQNAQGQNLNLPIMDVHNPALVHDYQAEGLKVYMKDIVFDKQGNPVILFLTSKGYESGPQNDPRTWHTARWNGEQWDIHSAMISDNNYDMGSLYIEDDGIWRLIAPTQIGPQRYNPGGEMAMWASRNQGKSWTMLKQLTSDSERNHTYARRPVNAHPDFYALWADGNPRELSDSALYFTNKTGAQVWKLPSKMTRDFEAPAVLPYGW